MRSDTMSDETGVNALKGIVVNPRIEQALQEVASLLLQRNIKIVFAESCTAGLISATLGRVAGISNVHCGSAVVYRLDTKTKWLGVPAPLLIDPGAVSDPVARAMAEGVLSHTPEAVMAVSITGHLGPGAPAEQDGLIFVGIATRSRPCQVIEHRVPIWEPDDRSRSYPGSTLREQRQWAAVEFVFAQILRTITTQPHNHLLSEGSGVGAGAGAGTNSVSGG
jgi:nicotinamide-nucleotide amidase